MICSKKVVCIIPARLSSSRFPKKVLASLKDKPLLQWVYQAAKSCEVFDEIAFAVDAVETYDLVKTFTPHVYYTSVDCQSGTDRLIELKEKKVIQGDIWVNWQADEPFITKDMIDSLLKDVDHPLTEIWTLRKCIEDKKEMFNPSVVKVVTDSSGKALYFSRFPIPYSQQDVGHLYYKHLGIYAYSSNALNKIGLMEPASLEKSESLEQLRFLYHGMRIQVHETSKETLGIDTPEDLALAMQWLAK